MLRKHIHYTLPLFLIIILSGIVGCVRPAGEDIAPQVAQLPTFTITPSETFTPTITLTPSETGIVLVKEITATSTPTQTPSLTPVQSFLAQSAQEATTPTVVGVNEFQLTATAIVAGATATIDAQLTATALASGIGLPTQTSTPDLVATQAAAFALTPNVALPTANSVAVVVVPGADCVHEVRAQDRSLYRLSLAYGLTVNDIATANGIINPDIISVGQRLTIPGCGTTGGIPPATTTPVPTIVASLPTSGGTQTGGATSSVFVTPPDGDCTWGTTVIFPSGCPTGLTSSASAITAQSSTGGATAITASRRHTVQQGESLFAISLQYGVSMSDIVALNGITNVDLIDLGDVLLIP